MESENKKERSTMFDGKITRQMLKTKSGEFDVESIHTLVLREQDVSDLGCLGECTALETLNLSKNDVTKLYSLAGLTQLSHLNLSANRIQSLDGLQSLENLKSLNLAGNLIGSVDVLRTLSGLEKLTDLRLKDPVRGLSNPLCMNQSYKADVKAVLPNLVNLDGERLAGRGSEVFRMLEQMDMALPACNIDDSTSQSGEPGPWVSPDYWEPSKDFENSSLGDADKQLQDLLAECRRVGAEAEQRIKAAIEAKQSNEGAS